MSGSLGNCAQGFQTFARQYAIGSFILSGYDISESVCANCGEVVRDADLSVHRICPKCHNSVDIPEGD